MSISLKKEFLQKIAKGLKNKEDIEKYFKNYFMNEIVTLRETEDYCFVLRLSDFFNNEQTMNTIVNQILEINKTIHINNGKVENNLLKLDKKEVENYIKNLNKDNGILENRSKSDEDKYVKKYWE